MAGAGAMRIGTFLGRGLAGAALLGALAACATGSNPVRDVVAGAGFGPKIRPAPDFIAHSRRPDLDYLPVGRPADAPSPQGKREDEVRAAEAEMEALRARNEARGAEARRSAGGTAAAPRR